MNEVYYIIVGCVGEKPNVVLKKGHLFYFSVDSNGGSIEIPIAKYMVELTIRKSFKDEKIQSTIIHSSNMPDAVSESINKELREIINRLLDEEDISYLIFRLDVRDEIDVTKLNMLYFSHK